MLVQMPSLAPSSPGGACVCPVGERSAKVNEEALGLACVGSLCPDATQHSLEGSPRSGGQGI